MHPIVQYQQDLHACIGMASYHTDGGQSGSAVLDEEVDDDAVPDEVLAAEGHATSQAKGKGILLPMSEEGRASGSQESLTILVTDGSAANEGGSRQTSENAIVVSSTLSRPNSAASTTPSAPTAIASSALSSHTELHTNQASPAPPIVPDALPPPLPTMLAAEPQPQSQLLLPSLLLPLVPSPPPAYASRRDPERPTTSTLTETRRRLQSPSPPLPPPPPSPRPRAVSEWVPSTRQEQTSVVLPSLRDALQDVSLPRWQPDAEVTYCPICRTQFSIFVRKHHCSCSPHRITIPYQYIVHPPGWYSFRTQAAAAASVGDGGVGGFGNSPIDVSTLGGGERVRLCNPCVPDPNIAPPHTAWSSDLASLFPSTGPQTRGQYRTVRTVWGPSRGPMFATFHPLPPGAVRQPSSVGPDSLLTVSPASPSSQRHHRLSLPPPSSAPGTSSEPQMHFVVHQRRTQRPGLADPTTRQQIRQPQYQARAQPLAEEDECPVCHLELPSRQLSSFEEQREQHIMDCLEAHGGSHQGRRRTASGDGNSPRGGGSSGNGGSSNSSSSSSGGGSSTDGISGDGGVFRQPQPHVWRTGMFPYLATEKDCVDAAECTICLEEFEVGVPMARLECLCRFHRECIQAWFVKHPGRCPVHNHDSSDY
ncbi:fyve domain containing protein [Grosmannia clavigera kw1407]|uniref:RING-type E3 ubiquitin transferase n=1 Tax=Grosmannia clavigera (strain kw1407 / UAMH 11150) TaxID=655863 RepID=F0XHF4_GROCL|nr:fyve domain containing protein [Grosmannia clavigera kw1407]EFX02655.1 fyve domain containing protein [Grosmannia clavigera kw1407]